MNPENEFTPAMRKAWNIIGPLCVLSFSILLIAISLISIKDIEFLQNIKWAKTIELLIQIVVAIATLAVAIIAIWGDWFKARFAAPRLRIELTIPTGEILPLSDHPGIQTVNQRYALWINAKVVNERRWVTPRNCRVLLRSLSRPRPDGVYEQIPLHVPLQYVWSPAEMSGPTVDIPHEHYFDFGCIANQPLHPPIHFRPILHSYTNNFRGYLNQGESIRYSLQIQADNFAPDRYQVFEVSWDGHWHNDITIMRQHFSIKEIK